MRLLNAIDEGRYSFEDLKRQIAEGERPPSTRSLRRYLAILSEAGFPWYFDRAANLYKFVDGYSLRRMQLSPNELFGLVALRSLGASLGGTIGAYLNNVSAKLVGLSGSGAQQEVEARAPFAFRVSEIHLEPEAERAFTLLSSAERNSRCVRFAYIDKEGRRSERTVDPYGFVISGGRIYLVAYDHTRRDKRVFAVDSVLKPEVTAATFAKPQDFDVESFSATSISGVLHSETTSEVRVRFAQRVAKAATAARIVPARAIERAEDGSAEITYHVADVDELLRWTLGWGNAAQIAGPPTVRDRMRVLVDSIAAHYAEKDETRRR